MGKRREQADGIDLWAAKCTRLLLILFVFLIIPPTLCCASSLAAPAIERKRVLVVNSYHQGYPWVDTVVESIRSEFDQSDVPTELYFEYLDTKRFLPKTVAPVLSSLLRTKYPDGFLDLIITSDKFALDFILQLREEIYSQTPVVFFGVAPELDNSVSNITGVVEITPYVETLNLALQLHPETNEIIITGNTTRSSAQSYHELFLTSTNALREQLTGKVKFTFMYNVPVRELLEQFKEMDGKQVVLPISLVPYGADGQDLMPTRYFSQKVKEVCNLPVYVISDIKMGMGAVGGKVFNSKKQGAQATELALRILRGEDADDIRLVNSHIDYMLDYRELSRFKIPLRSLPKDSVIINKPLQVYPIKKHYLWLIIGLLIGLVVVTILMLNTIRIRKQIAESLRKSEQRFRSVFETTVVGMVTITMDRKIMQTNPAFCQILGYSADSIFVNRNFDDFVFAEDQKKIEPQLAEMKSGDRRFYHCEMRYRHKNGEMVWGHNSISSVLGVDGLPMYYVSVVKDITEQKRSEMEVLASERKYRTLSREFVALLDGIPGSLVLLSPDMKVVWGNRGAANCFNTNPMTLQGQYWPAVRNIENSDEMIYCPAHRSFLSGKAEDGQNIDSDGHTWEVNAFPLKVQNGEVVSVVEMATDITEKLQFREEAMRSAQLASLGELAAGVAHEINNPISCIINYAELLLDEGGDDEVSHLTELYERIIREGCRVADIVGGLLSFARESKDEKNPISCREVFDETMTMIESQLEKDGIELRIDIAEDLPLVVAHKQQLQQVILNLLSNARYAVNLKYPRGGEYKRIDICGDMRQFNDNNFVRFTITDYGTGIPKHLQDKVLKPFFSTKTADKGTGLGLSISHGIIKDHNGKLTIESIEGKFTRITMALPVIKENGVCQ